MWQLGGGYVARTAFGVTAIVEDNPTATPSPAPPEAVLENTEKQGEDVNAIPEALKKGGCGANAHFFTFSTQTSNA